MNIIQKKHIITFLIFSLLFVSLYAQNQDVIVLPDISTELTSGNFEFDEDAIPDFSVEPLKEAPKQEIVEIKVPEPIEEKPIVVVEEVPFVETKKSEVVFKTGATVGFSSNFFEIKPVFGIQYFGDGYSLLGDINISMGGYSESKEIKKQFFALESLDFEAVFEMPKDLELVTKLGVHFLQSKVYDKNFNFAFPLAINIGYKGFAPWKIYGEIGQKTFRLFENSFYCALGGIVDFSMFSNKTELQFGKKIGIENTLSFSTNPEKYQVLFTFDYFIKESPCFSLSGIYKF
ncbi:MAG: hypothetical protein IKI98_04920 [Spirochaetaceae bacterium]|nr:hypothetical protein [Spirochaetaceae bacterium]